MPLLARAVLGVLNFLAARRGFESRKNGEEAPQPRARRRTGVRGESFAYWFLRRQGYLVVARNYRAPHLRGEIDLIAWEGDVLAFVEVKTRTTSTGGPPEQAVTPDKQRVLREMARDYLARRRLGDVAYRFDVLALEVRLGAPPRVRLHKGAFGAN